MSKRHETGFGADGEGPATAEAGWTQVAQCNFDPEGTEELTTAVVFAIAAARDVDPTAVKSPPLYDAVDVPAIEDAFFGPFGRRGSRQGDGSVEFRYDGLLVTVRSDGWIEVAEPVETASSS